MDPSAITSNAVSINSRKTNDSGLPEKTQTGKRNTVYFPNLNGLRFIAAFLVIIHHAEQLKYIIGLDSFWETAPFIKIVGKLGVILFFVLSGFLITYLLMEEERSFKKIDIRNFYMRRVLRIWPLYFLIVTLSLAVLPHISLFTLPGFPRQVVYENLSQKILLYVFFLPNLVLTLMGIVPYASHTWSIGTEEQFYLLWPLLLRKVKKHRIGLMAAVIFSYLLLSKGLATPLGAYIPYSKQITAFLSLFNIDCMAIGGIFAVLLFNKSSLIRHLHNPYLFYTVLFGTAGLIAAGIQVPYFHYEFYALLFGIIILNLASNTELKWSLEHPVLNYLGNISYGLYMYHLIAIVFSLYIAAKLHLPSNWFIYLASVIFSTLLAAVSYHYFERFFLKFKRKYSHVISGDPGR